MIIVLGGPRELLLPVHQACHCEVLFPFRRFPVFPEPEDIGLGLMLLHPLEEPRAPEGRMGFPEGYQFLDEGSQLAVLRQERPVHPADLVILAVCVVVALLRTAELVAGGDHRNAL